jgi:hypothetical protein
MLRAVAVLALVAIAVPSVGAVRSAPSPQQPPKEATQAANADRDRNKANAETDRAPLAVYNQTDPAVKGDAADKHAPDPDAKRSQNVVMVSAAVQAGSAFILLLLTGWLIGYSHKGWSVMNRQLEAYERPWVTVSLLEGDAARHGTNFGFMPDDSAYIFLQPVVVNIGKSLATDISITTDLVAMVDDSPLSPKILRELRARKPDLDKFTLFPGEENKRLRPHKTVSAEAIHAATFTNTDDGKQYVTIAFIGEILYRFANSKKPHHTRFAYLMRAKDSFGEDFVRIGAPYSGDQIVWIKLPGDDAN